MCFIFCLCYFILKSSVSQSCDWLFRASLTLLQGLVEVGEGVEQSLAMLSG